MNNLIQKILGLSKNPVSYSEAELIGYAQIALMGTGAYASYSMTDEWPEWSNKMQEDLLMFELNARKYSSPRLFILTGKGWESFAIWYRRKNEDKTTPLKHAVLMFHEALKIQPDNEEAKITLATILIERVQVRDLNYALSVLAKLSNKSSEVNLLISKAKRWIGEIEFESNFDYSNIQLIPLGPLREERKKCRALIQKLKKEKRMDEIAKVLEHMYRIAVLHDVATYVMLYCEYSIDPKVDRAWDKRLNKIARNIFKYSYTINGKIIESNNCFFSNKDYKVYEMIYGTTDMVFNPVSLIELTNRKE